MKPLFPSTAQPPQGDRAIADWILAYLEAHPEDQGASGTALPKKPLGIDPNGLPGRMIAFSAPPDENSAKAAVVPALAAIAWSIDQSFRHRLGRPPSESELLATLTQHPSFRTAMVAQRSARARNAATIEVEELPAPVRQSPFNALNNYPIVGFTADGRPIRSNKPNMAIEIDRPMERREMPGRPLPWQERIHWRDI